MNNYSVATYLLLVAVCLAFSIGESSMTPCDVPSEVSHCMNLMRTAEDIDDVTTSDFINLQDKLKSIRTESCEWKGADLKMTPGDCITTLSRFVEGNGSGNEIMLQSSVRISGGQCRRRCLRVCNEAPPVARPECRRLCNRIVRNDNVRISARQCRSRCRGFCDRAPSSARRQCRRACNDII